MSGHLRDNLRWSFTWASWFAGILSAWVVVVSLLRGSFQWPQYHTTTWGIVLSYWGGAAIAGTILGAFRPLIKFRLGAFIIGWTTGTMIYGSIAVALGFAMGAPLWLWAIPGLIVGGGLSLVWFDDGLAGPRQNETSWRFVGVVLGVAAALMIAMKVAGWW
jgi:hypothetical protein